MSEEPTPLALALGRVPTGLYILSTLDGERDLGFVASFVTQVGIAPPTMAVAVGKERGPLAAIRESGGFALSILDEASKGVMGGFFRPPAEGQTPFDALETSRTPRGAAVLDDALAWLDCRVTGEFETGDHVVVFGEVLAGELQRAGDPALHLRKSGLGY